MSFFKQPSFFDESSEPANIAAPADDVRDAPPDDPEPDSSDSEVLSSGPTEDSEARAGSGGGDATDAESVAGEPLTEAVGAWRPEGTEPPAETSATTEDFSSFWGPRDDASLEAPAASADAASTGVIADPGQDAVDAFFGPPRLDRPRPERAPLIPRRVWIGAAGVLVVVMLVVIGTFLSGRAVNITVPQLTGSDVDTAKTRLAEEGLSLTVTERRFSSSATGMVLSQTPQPGTKAKSGDVVSVVVSAGSEQFALPNVVGNGLLLAKGQLETRGLEVRVEPQPSQQPSDSVLASNPPAGSAVHTGDIVRLTVAAPGPAAALLLPYDMNGVTVVIDPAPVNDAQADVTLNIARTLRSLIEASHGVVVATRALADTNVLEDVATRAQRAAASTATVALGLSTTPVGSGGLTVYAPSPVLAFASASARLSSRIASDLASEAGSVKSATSTTDTVLVAAKSPWSRVELGSFAQREDVAKFTDATWEDSVARALYRAIASTYGKKTASP